MANRTVQILGQGYGATPSEITVTTNGNTVFSGPVNTQDQTVPALPNLDLTLANILCTFEIDLAFSGQIPMTCTVASGTVIFTEILANYVSIPNPVYTPTQLATLSNFDTPWSESVAIYTEVANPPFSQQDIDTLLDPTVTKEEKNAIKVAHNCTMTVSSGADGYGLIYNDDSRSQVTINGIETPAGHVAPYDGTNWWTINAGSTLSYNLNVGPATV
jgi:hypothetical protein